MEFPHININNKYDTTRSVSTSLSAKLSHQLNNNVIFAVALPRKLSSTASPFFQPEPIYESKQSPYGDYETFCRGQLAHVDCYFILLKRR